MMSSCNGVRDTRYVPGSYWYAYGSSAYKVAACGGAAAGSDRSNLWVIEGGARPTAARNRPVCAAQQAATPTHDEDTAFFGRVGRLAPCSQRPAAIFRMLVAALAVAVALAVAMTFVSLPADAAAVADVPTAAVAVAPGDSLWSLAERHPIEGLSTQQCVRWIMARNALESSVLVPGQAIEVPAV